MAPGGAAFTRVVDLNIYLAPFYIKNLPFYDGWGGVIMYDSGPIGPNQDLYSIYSYGRDRAYTGVDVTNSNYVITTMNGFDNDICFSNGIFTYVSKIK